MTEFLIGLAVGCALLLPAAVVLVRRAVARTRRAEALARVGERWEELASSAPVLVHDLKQPLSTLKVNLQLLAEDLGEISEQQEPAGRARRRAENLRGEVDRLEGILKDFQRYAGKPVLDRKPVDLNIVVEQLVDFFNPQAGQHKIAVRAGYAPAPVPVPADAERLKEALLNLLVNAQQAMAGGGELIVRVGSNAAEATVEIADTGPGIPPELMPRLFQASFTTKPDGSGLGLPTVRRIIEEHGGKIGVHSEPGKGTSFTITLPRAG
jgi:signal transduction histidine kinase